MIKKILAVIVVVALVIGAVMAIRHAVKPHAPRLVYQDNIITVMGSKGFLSVSDSIAGEEYRYRLTRTRHATAGAQTAHTSVSTDSLTISTVYALVIVTELETGKTLYFKVR